MPTSLHAQPAFRSAHAQTRPCDVPKLSFRAERQTPARWPLAPREQATALAHSVKRFKSIYAVHTTSIYVVSTVPHALLYISTSGSTCYFLTLPSGGLVTLVFTGKRNGCQICLFRVCNRWHVVYRVVRAGDAQQMFSSLSKLAALPPETVF